MLGPESSVATVVLAPSAVTLSWSGCQPLATYDVFLVKRARVLIFQKTDGCGWYGGRRGGEVVRTQAQDRDSIELASAGRADANDD